MKSQTLNNTKSHLAKLVAPEDLQRGEYVAILDETFELPSFLWCCDSQLSSSDEPVRVTFQTQRPGHPLRVVEVCFPFVLVDQPRGGRFSLDIRSCQLVRLKKRFAKAAWRAKPSKHGEFTC